MSLSRTKLIKSYKSNKVSSKKIKTLCDFVLIFTHNSFLFWYHPAQMKQKSAFVLLKLKGLADNV